MVSFFIEELICYLIEVDRRWLDILKIFFKWQTQNINQTECFELHGTSMKLVDEIFYFWLCWVALRFPIWLNFPSTVPIKIKKNILSCKFDSLHNSFIFYLCRLISSKPYTHVMMSMSSRCCCCSSRGLVMWVIVSCCSGRCGWGV